MPAQLLPSGSGSAPFFASGSGPAPFSLLCGTPSRYLGQDPSPSSASCPVSVGVPATLVVSARQRESCGSPQMAPSAPNSPSQSPAPDVPLRLPKAPSSGADTRAARRLGMARPVGTDSPKAGSGRRAHEGKPGSRTAQSDGAITGRASGAKLGPKAGLDARRPGLRGAPGRAGGRRGRGGGIPRRRRPERLLARNPS